MQVRAGSRIALAQVLRLNRRSGRGSAPTGVIFATQFVFCVIGASLFAAVALAE